MLYTLLDLSSCIVCEFNRPYFPFKGGGGGVQGQKSWKHDFEITGDPKVPPSGSTFWSGFEAPDLVATPFENKNQKWQIWPKTGIC